MPVSARSWSVKWPYKYFKMAYPSVKMDKKTIKLKMEKMNSHRGRSKQIQNTLLRDDNFYSLRGSEKATQDTFCFELGIEDMWYSDDF